MNRGTGDEALRGGFYAFDARFSSLLSFLPPSPVRYYHHYPNISIFLSLVPLFPYSPDPPFPQYILKIRIAVTTIDGLTGTLEFETLDEIKDFQLKFAEIKKLENLDRVAGFIFSRAGFTAEAEAYCKEKGIACSEDERWLETGKLKLPAVW